jgi:hypothetical protein
VTRDSRFLINTVLELNLGSLVDFSGDSRNSTTRIPTDLTLVFNELSYSEVQDM